VNQPAIIEMVTNFFASLAQEDNLNVLKPYKKEVSEIFYSENFF